MVKAHPRPQRWLDPPDSHFLLDSHASKGARGLSAESPHFYCQYYPMSPSSLSPLIGCSRAKASGPPLYASMSNWKHWQRKKTLLQPLRSTSPSCYALALLHISTNEACPHHHGEQLLLRKFVKRKRDGKMGPSLTDDAQKDTTSTDEQTSQEQLSVSWRKVPTGIMTLYGHAHQYNDNNEDDEDEDDYHHDDGCNGSSHANDGQAKPLVSSSVRGEFRGSISNIEGLPLSLASSPTSSPSTSVPLSPVPSNFTASATPCYTSHLPLVRTSAFEITAPTPSATSMDGAAPSFPNLGIKKNTHSSAASNSSSFSSSSSSSSSSVCSSSFFSYYSTSSPSSSFLNPRGNNILSESLPEPVTPSSKRHHAKPSRRQHIHLRSCRWIAIIVVQWLRWLFHVISPLPHLSIPRQPWQELASSVLCDVTNNCSRVKKLCWWWWMRWSSSPSHCFAFSKPFSTSTPAAGWISLARPWPSLCRGCMRTTPTQRKSLSSYLSHRPTRMVPRIRHPAPLAPSFGGWTSTMFALGVLLLVHLVVVDSAKIGSFQCGYGVSASLACLPKDYSKFELPMKTGVNEISVSIHIDEVLRINDKDYSITFACYFNVKWPDKRIRLDQDFGQEQAGPGVNVTNNPNILVPMSLEMVKDLWLPNIFIYNIKTYKVIDVLNKLAGLWIGTDKSVMYSQATHITFICPMRFDKFPLDTQTCKFQVGSYSYDDSKMTFETDVAAYSEPKTSNSIALDYAITINKLKRSDQVFLGGPLGNFSLAGFEMVLHRYVSTYIITYYLPSGLFVIVSWISFLIPMDVIPGRMALLVTLFLVLVNIFNTVTTNTPKAEGLTAIEAWMLACILFVFGALIEYAAILFKKQRYVSSQHRLNIKIVCKDNFKYEVQERAATSAVSLQQLAEEYWRIDKFFLISFPILFFIFNIIYWLAFIL